MQTPSPETIQEAARLSPIGWIFMLSSLAFVWVLTFRCFKKVLAGPSEIPAPVKDFHNA
ncbi:MAG: hypothetical protein ABL998_15785 [Planctomycetota bacterium]